jgi:hypothetical protein
MELDLLSIVQFIWLSWTSLQDFFLEPRARPSALSPTRLVRYVNSGRVLTLLFRLKLDPSCGCGSC